MSYFEKFPLARYRFNDAEILGVDVTQRTGVLNQTPDNYIETEIMDGESPELLADRMYDDATLAWIILFYNNIFNVFEEWPRDYSSLNDYINAKYDDPQAIHHYESASTGLRVSETHEEYDRVPVTNYEYEVSLNDERRSIKLPIPEVVEQIVNQHNELMSNG